MMSRRYAQRLVQNLRSKVYSSARSAWEVVDTLERIAASGECSSHEVSMGRWLCQRAYGFRPCARVGLRTKPFSVARTRKAAELRSVGRVKGGHRGCGIRADENRWFGS